jgi:GNAT superfamily N-acetyltransferase
VKSSEFSVGNIRQTVRRILCDDFSWCDDQDQLVVEQQIHQVRIFIRCDRAARGCLGKTLLDCSLDFDACEMWIGNLHVAAAYRRRGRGRALVRLAESIAGATMMRDINVFPLQGSLSFWSKMGYTPKPYISRVLVKDVFVVRDLAEYQERHRADRERQLS